MAGDATPYPDRDQFRPRARSEWFLLRGPHRLVLDLPDTRVRVDAKESEGTWAGEVGALRGTSSAGKSRLILVAKGPFEVERFDILPNETSPGYRLVADCPRPPKSEFEAALANKSQTTGSTRRRRRATGVHRAEAGREALPHRDRSGPWRYRRRRQGRERHRGEGDHAGLCQRTARQACDSRQFDVFMTREKRRVPAARRARAIARQHEADLFISIHADTINVPGIHGATVYTVADKASDAEAQALADRENLSDELAGIEIKEDNQEVADILVDLIRRETHSYLGALRPLAGRRASTDRRPDQEPAPLRRFQGAARRPTCRRCWSNSAICPTPRTRSSCAIRTGAARRSTASRTRSRVCVGKTDAGG